MNVEQFVTAYNFSRNGANQLFRHPLSKRLVFSDGMAEVAEAGLFWFIDLVAFELLPKLFNSGETLVVLKLTVKGGSAKVIGTGSGDRKVLTRKIDFTDCPDGEWNFYVGVEDDHCVLILPTEY